MESHNIQSRSLYISYLILYWIPILFLCLYASLYLQWWLIIAALGLSSAGMIALLAISRSWEKEIKRSIKSQEKPQISLASKYEMEELQHNLNELENKLEELKQQLHDKRDEIALLNKEKQEEKLESDSLKLQLAQLKNLYSDLRVQYQNSQEELNKISTEAQALHNSKDKYIENLENKISDLNYEIKTILKVAQESTA